MAQQAMVTLQERSNQFQTAARQNWDVRLAMPGSTPTPNSPDVTYTSVSESFQSNPGSPNGRTSPNARPSRPSFANVPTND
jgi:hypothetical protein